MALAFQDVVEGAHMGHPDFRARGKKIFATLNADETRGMVSLTPEQQREVMLAYPAMFAPASGAWGVQGATMVELRWARAEAVGEAMTLAWQRAHAAVVAKGARPRKAPGTRRR
jgi:YjbR